MGPLLQKFIAGIKRRTAKASKRGFVMPVVLGFTFMFSLEVVGLSVYSTSTQQQIRSHEQMMRTFYMAESATQKALAQIRLHINDFGRLPTQAELNQMALPENQLQTSGYYNFPEYQLNLINTQQQQLTTGDYAGLNANVSSIQVSINAINTANVGTDSQRMTQVIEVQQIPVFQFGVFYDNDLEILPGPNMTFVGPVHSNMDIYLGSHNTLTFDSTITSAGKIYHDRKDSGSSMTGDVQILDGASVYQDMLNGDGTWLDSNHTDWVVDSQSRWSGNVKSDVHNTTTLQIPLPQGEDARMIIERRDAGDGETEEEQKMDYKADIRIIDGQIMDQQGNTLNLNYCADGSEWETCPSSLQKKPIQFPSQSFSGTCDNSKHFTNFREDKCIKATDVKVDLLEDSPVFQDLMAQNPDGIVIYHSDQRNISSAQYQDALRLKNGSELPASMTFASENPLYIKGDYNTVNKKPAGAISDAFNVLSNSWSDSNSDSSNLNNRKASNTNINVAVITGNMETQVGGYNGGFENIHRFLEKWSGKTLSYSGSVAALYESQIATGPWQYGGDNYTAPGRDWGYDQDLGDENVVVPGFPSVINIELGNWSQD